MTFAANHPVSRDQAKVMNRFDITKRMVARLKHDEAVIGGIGYTNFDLWAAGRRPQNFYMLGSMGLAVPIALGVALAQPQRKVIALEGDGSILMQLGSLATVAARKQKNLAIAIMDNGDVPDHRRAAYRRPSLARTLWRSRAVPASSRAPGRRTRARSRS